MHTRGGGKRGRGGGADADLSTAACRQHPFALSLWMVTGGADKKEMVLCIEIDRKMQKQRLRQYGLQAADTSQAQTR